MSIRMSAKMREIRAQINEKVTQARELLDKKDLEGARALQTEINDLRVSYDVEEAAFMLEQEQKGNPACGEPEDEGEKEYNSKLFYKALTGETLTETEKSLVSRARTSYKNKLAEGSKEDGGITVPDDLSKQIIKRIEDEETVRSLVSVENVNTLTGTRITRTGTPNKLYNTAERGAIQEMNNPKYGTITYKQHKFAGKMDVSNELLADSFVNFVEEITEWLSDASRETENEEILYGKGGENACEGLLSTAGKFKTYAVPAAGLNIDFLRSIKFSLKKGYRTKAHWLMNTDAFVEISKLKDNNGRSYLQPDPRQPETYVLLGHHVEVKDFVRTEEGKTKICFGNYKRAYRMFARKNFGIRFTDIGSNAFDTDTVVARGIERFDGRIMDTEAMVIIKDVAVTAITPIVPDSERSSETETTYTEAELKSMTKEQLLAICAERGITSVDNSSLKDDIVAAILAGE